MLHFELHFFLLSSSYPLLIRAISDEIIRKWLLIDEITMILVAETISSSDIAGLVLRPECRQYSSANGIFKIGVLLP